MKTVQQLLLASTVPSQQHHPQKASPDFAAGDSSHPTDKLHQLLLGMKGSGQGGNKRLKREDDRNTPPIPTPPNDDVVNQDEGEPSGAEYDFVRERRKEQNRRAAHVSRNRKRLLTEELQKTVGLFTQANTVIRQKNAELESLLFSAQTYIRTNMPDDKSICGGKGNGQVEENDKPLTEQKQKPRERDAETSSSKKSAESSLPPIGTTMDAMLKFQMAVASSMDSLQHKNVAPTATTAALSSATAVAAPILKEQLAVPPQPPSVNPLLGLSFATPTIPPPVTDPATSWMTNAFAAAAAAASMAASNPYANPLFLQFMHQQPQYQPSLNPFLQPMLQPELHQVELQQQLLMHQQRLIQQNAMILQAQQQQAMGLLTSPLTAVPVPKVEHYKDDNGNEPKRDDSNSSDKK